jgi:uncharacterized RDD family membrane protein YckC
MKTGVVPARTHVRTIRTPEGVRFSLPLAGPVSRCLAWLVDALCLVAFAQVVQVAVALMGFISKDLSQAIT